MAWNNRPMEVTTANRMTSSSITATSSQLATSTTTRTITTVAGTATSSNVSIVYSYGDMQQQQMTQPINTAEPRFLPHIYWQNNNAAQRRPANTQNNHFSNSNVEFGWGLEPDPSHHNVIQSCNLRASNSWTDYGKIARSWNLKFNGDTGMDVEEFLQRLDECRRLAHMEDEDLLNSLTEVTEDSALIWCRQLRRTWRTWNDFCVAARRDFSTDIDYQNRLLGEALRRKQGKNESVRRYIFCLLTLLDKLQEPLSNERQLSLIYNNMLAKIKKQVPRDKVKNLDVLLTLARQAEQLNFEEDNYVDPPSAEDSICPELAYKDPDKQKNQNKQISQVSTTDAIPQELLDSVKEFASLVRNFAEGNTDSQSLSTSTTPSDEEEEDPITAIDRSLQIATVSVDSDGNEGTPKDWLTDLGSCMTTLRKLFSPDGEAKPSHVTQSFKRRKKKRRRNSDRRLFLSSEEVKKRKRVHRTPDDDKNQSQLPGPLPKTVICYGCSWPGYVKSFCPDCSRKRQKTVGEVVKTSPDTENNLNNTKATCTGKKSEYARPFSKEKRKRAVCRYNRWWLPLKIGGFRIRALVDSGAARTVLGPVGQQIAKNCKKNISPYKGCETRLANGQASPVYGCVELPFEVVDQMKNMDILIMNDLEADCILGADFMRLFNAVLWPRQDCLRIEGVEEAIPLETSASFADNSSALALISVS